MFPRPSGRLTAVDDQGRDVVDGGATMRDVARIAGVSVSTVSHVVNSTRLVSPVRRRRVLEAIAAIGYTQHAGARALRRSRSDTVGLVVSNTGHPVFAEMVRGVEDEARVAGKTLLLANSSEEVDREANSVRALREHRVDGLLLAPVASSPDTLVEQLRTQGFPVVLLDRLTNPGTDQVGVATIGPMRDLVAHLVARGHRRIGLVVGDLAVPPLRERWQGYQDALTAEGIPHREELLHTSHHVTTREEAASAVGTMLDGPEPPTAIANGNDFTAMAGILDAARARGMRVPDDLAVVSFDAFPHAELFEPALTSYAQPAYMIGREAMRLLLRRLKKPTVAPKTIRLEPVLAHRTSCGCAPGADFVLPTLARQGRKTR